MEVRDATDTTCASVHQIVMGLVRENGEWKLLSLGLLLLDLPALEVEWDAAEMESTEKSAIASLKKVSAAVETYRNKYPHLPESLANLGPPLHGAANGEAAGLIDSDLANGMKNGYAIRYVIVGASTLGAPAKYELAATPMQYGRTGRRSFFRDSNGALHAADRHGAVRSEADPKVNYSFLLCVSVDARTDAQHFPWICARRDLALLSCGSVCLAKCQRDFSLFSSHFFRSLLLERRPGHKAISPTGLFRSSSCTAASGSIFITRFLTKPGCRPQQRSRKKAASPPGQL